MLALRGSKNIYGRRSEVWMDVLYCTRKDEGFSTTPQGMNQTLALASVYELNVQVNIRSPRIILSKYSVYQPSLV